LLRSKRGHLASEILGYHVIDRHSRKIGKVNDLLIDSVTYLVNYIIAGKDKIIPVSFINSDNHVKKLITISQPKDRVKEALFRKAGPIPRKSFSYSEIKKSVIYDITGLKLGNIEDIAFHPGLKSDFLVGKTEEARISTIIDFSTDYHVIPKDYIGHMLKNSIVLSVSKDELEMVNFSGYEEMFNKKRPEHVNKKRYVIVEAPTSTVSHYLGQHEETIDKATESLFIEELDVLSSGKVYQFVNLFNMVLSTSPDTYSPLTDEDVKEYYKQGTFVAYEYYKPVGYSCLTIEVNEENTKTIGVIAGIGVHPSKRGRRIALTLLERSIKYLIDKGADVIQADIYELNFPSLKFFSSLGFKEIDETFLA